MSSDSNIPSVDALFEDLMHPNPRIQEEACLILSENYREEALPRLLDLFCHHDPKVYRAAVKGVGFFGSSAFDPIIKLYANTKILPAKSNCRKAFVNMFNSYQCQ